ncbi:MAG: FAD-binding oxidoreductase [Methylomicrobium sp.]|nr:FAD-binding oxidoreductase [Methylomicrobium sp.]
MNIDYLIVGQGLAGSLLGWELIQRGCKVLVVDSGANNASQIAAGLINPVTGQRFVKADETNQLMAFNRTYYHQLAQHFGQDFLHEKRMLRLLRDETEYRFALKRLKDSRYRPYLASLLPPDRLEIPCHHLRAVLVQKQTSYLLTRPLLACLREFFMINGHFRPTLFNYSDVQLTPSLSWQDIRPNRIIFCEGYQLINNPWFNWLPLQPAKGEILTLENPTKIPPLMLNFGHWLVPLDDHRIRLGATFIRNDLSLEPTQQGEKLLMDSLYRLTGFFNKAKIIASDANIRPCTSDRMPFVGSHPKYSQLSVFNGFGAKGSLQIPWYSAHLADSLVADQLISPSCDIKRHYASHFIG